MNSNNRSFVGVKMLCNFNVKPKITHELIFNTALLRIYYNTDTTACVYTTFANSFANPAECKINLNDVRDVIKLA